MKIIESISVSEDITLFSLSDFPADISFVAGIFDKIAETGIDVDMISQFLPNGSHSGLSFTVSALRYSSTNMTTDKSHASSSVRRGVEATLASRSRKPISPSEA